MTCYERNTKKRKEERERKKGGRQREGRGKKKGEREEGKKIKRLMKPLFKCLGLREALCVLSVSTLSSTVLDPTVYGGGKIRTLRAGSSL